MRPVWPLLYPLSLAGNPEAELGLAFDAIGPVLQRFVTIEDIFEPVDDGKASGIFITKVAAVD